MNRSTEKRALELLHAFERVGKSVSRIAIDGKRIELEFSSGDLSDDFDRVEMQHGKT